MFGIKSIWVKELLKGQFKPDASQIWPFKSVSFLLPTANSPYWAIFAPSGWNSDPFLPPPVLAGGSGGVGCLFVKLVVVSKMVAQNKQQLLVNQPWHQAKKNTCYKLGLTFFLKGTRWPTKRTSRSEPPMILLVNKGIPNNPLHNHKKHRWLSRVWPS